jgi:hypothetical protein
MVHTLVVLLSDRQARAGCALRWALCRSFAPGLLKLMVCGFMIEYTSTVPLRLPA